MSSPHAELATYTRSFNYDDAARVICNLDMLDLYASIKKAHSLRKADHFFYPKSAHVSTAEKLLPSVEFFDSSITADPDYCRLLQSAHPDWSRQTLVAEAHRRKASHHKQS